MSSGRGRICAQRGSRATDRQSNTVTIGEQEDVSYAREFVYLNISQMFGGGNAPTDTKRSVGMETERPNCKSIEWLLGRVHGSSCSQARLRDVTSSHAR